jgi:putative phosphonate metabolism protein
VNDPLVEDRLADAPQAPSHVGAARYAIYYAPPVGSALAQLGWRWLGRGPDRRDPRRRTCLSGIDAAEHDLKTAETCRYGFHGTLKAPFRLADSCDIQDLLDAVGRFASSHPPIEGPALQVSLLSGFLSLQPRDEFPALDDLAADCVVAFDLFRAPLRDDEIVRRRAAGLTPRQEGHLTRWGYPYVFDEFRFHMTLTTPLPPERLLTWWRAADELARPMLRRPFRVSEICVFRERMPRADFRLYARFPLGG